MTDRLVYSTFKAGGNAVCTFMSQTVAPSKKKKKVQKDSKSADVLRMCFSTAGSNRNHIEKHIHWVYTKKCHSKVGKD